MGDNEMNMGTGAAGGAAAGATAGSALPGVGTAVGAGVGALVGAGGAYLTMRGKKKEAAAKEAALNRWKQRRLELARALSDNYLAQGRDQQQGLTTQLQGLGDGSALRRALSDVPDATVTTAAPTGMDPAMAEVFARRAATANELANAGIAVDTAGRRRTAFADALDTNAAQASAPSRFRGVGYSRGRFLNAQQVADADAIFQREFGEVPNSARNQQLLGTLMQTLGPSAVSIAARKG